MSAAPAYRDPMGYPARPIVRPNPRQTARVRSSAGFQLRVLTAYGLTFAVVAMTAFGFSCLVGHSLKEQARREAILAASRAKAARSDVADLRNTVEGLLSLKSLNDWAIARGLTPSLAGAVARREEEAVRPLARALAPRRRPVVQVLVAKVADASDVR